MKMLELLRVAIIALRVNLLRSILTMLGIVIGVSCVITMVTVSAGAQEQIDRQMESLGSNLLMIYSSSRRAWRGSAGERRKSVTERIGR